MWTKWPTNKVSGQKAQLNIVTQGPMCNTRSFVKTLSTDKTTIWKLSRRAYMKDLGFPLNTFNRINYRPQNFFARTYVNDREFCQITFYRCNYHFGKSRTRAYVRILEFSQMDFQRHYQNLKRVGSGLKKMKETGPTWLD